MLNIMGIVVVLCILGVLVHFIYSFIANGKHAALPTELINQDMFAVRDPIIAEVPKSAVADSHWYVKAFMRPRRKKV